MTPNQKITYKPPRSENTGIWYSVYSWLVSGNNFPANQSKFSSLGLYTSILFDISTVTSYARIYCGGMPVVHVVDDESVTDLAMRIT